MAVVAEFISVLRKIRDVIYPEVNALYEDSLVLKESIDAGKAEIDADLIQFNTEYSDFNTKKNQVDVAVASAQSSATSANNSAIIATNKSNEIKAITAQSTTGAPGTSAYASYNPTDGKFTFNIPQGIKGDKGESFTVNSSGITASRTLYDAQPTGWSFLDITTSTLYFKASNTSGDWSSGVPFGKGDKGDKGDTGVGITSFTFVSTNHISGLPAQPGGTDIYRVTLTNTLTFEYQVYNGLNNKLEILKTIEELLAYNGSDAVIVEDIERGGTFVYKTAIEIDPNTGSLYTVNGGTVFTKLGGGFWVRQYSGAVNVKWFGAKGDGITDDTVAIQNAIIEAYYNNGKVEFTKSTYKILGTIILLSKTEIDFKNSTIIGGGMTSGITMFESGTMINGIPTSNIGTPIESNLVYGLAVRNGTIKDVGTVFNFYNVLNRSELKFLEFKDCMLAMRLDRCFYASVENILYWGETINKEQDSFTFIFENFVNVLNLKNIACSMRSKGVQFRHNANGQKVENCTAENCGIGFELYGGPTGPIEFDTCYFEYNDVAINLFGGLNKNPITVKNSWFYSNTVGISGDIVGGNCSIDIQSSNMFKDNTTNVDIIDYITDKSKLSLRSTILSQNNLPSPLSGYNVQTGTEVDKMVSMYRTSDYRQIVNSKDNGTSCIPFNLFGDSGDNIAGTIPFCTHTKTAGTSFSIHIDTKIRYRDINNLLAYNIQVQTTGQGFVNFYGNIYGNNLKELSANSANIAISNNSGYLRISILNRTDTGATYGITGIIRHI